MVRCFWKGVGGCDEWEEEVCGGDGGGGGGWWGFLTTLAQRSIIEFP